MAHDLYRVRWRQDYGEGLENCDLLCRAPSPQSARARLNAEEDVGPIRDKSCRVDRIDSEADLMLAGHIYARVFIYDSRDDLTDFEHMKSGFLGDDSSGQREIIHELRERWQELANEAEAARCQLSFA